jgi:hypothetical protein
MREVTIVSGVHSLHSHVHLSLAVAKSKRADTTHDVTMEGTYSLRYLPFLDSNLLLHQFRRFLFVAQY